MHNAITLVLVTILCFTVSWVFEIWMPVLFNAAFVNLWPRGTWPILLTEDDE